MASQPYVALGDSYAAGIGVGSPKDGRTDAGYPVQVAKSLGVDLAYRAVIGATVRDVIDDQVSAVGKETELVTITVGGNDVGFVPVVIAAAEPEWLSDLDGALRKARATMHEELPGRLNDLFTQVRERAPDAQIVVTGYPHLFGDPGRDCSPFTFFSADDMRKLNEADDELDDVIRTAAQKSGATFVDVRAEFRGHEVCADQAWLNTLTWPMENSFHPKKEGHDAYASAVLAGVAPAGGATRERDPHTSVTVETADQTRGSAPTFAARDFVRGRNWPSRYVRAARDAGGGTGR